MRTKSARSRLADRRAVPPCARGDPVGRPLRVKHIGEPVHLVHPAEAILPIGGTTSDELATRLAAWLADVAMNDQGAA